jgi:hypothetical protein
VGPRIDLDVMERRKNLSMPGLELRPRSQLLYRLSYPVSLILTKLLDFTVSLKLVKFLFGSWACRMPVEDSLFACIFLLPPMAI